MADYQKEYLDKLTNEYLPAFLAFGMKNINDLHEAEEFSQETAYQCVLAINKAESISNFNAFIWGIVHNSYKRWCARKIYISLDDDSQYSSFVKIMSDDAPIESRIIQEESNNRIRLELSRLTDLYRKTMVCFYYDELSIAETAGKLDISVEMVKFYLQKGRQKLKEAYTMSSTNNIGEKSFNPAPFAVYRNTMDFCSVNVWEIFKRKLPCQIALICFDSPKTTDEICLETGTPAVYIEDELQILLDSELLVSPVKGKYRTNFFILRNNAFKQLQEQFEKMYTQYVPAVITAYEKYLLEMKQCGIFKYDAPDSRYAWFFEGRVIEFIGSDDFCEDDYMTLADGVKGLVFAQEEAYAKNTKGHSTAYSEKDNITMRASSPNNFHYQRCERELVRPAAVNKDYSKISALYAVYKGDTNESDAMIYAQLIEQGYIFKENGKLVSDIAVHTAKSKELFKKINAELKLVLSPLCKEIYENVSRIVASTIPPQLKQYTRGYTSMYLGFYAGIYFREELYSKGFVTIPENSDKTPVSCWIDEH